MTKFKYDKLGMMQLNNVYGQVKDASNIINGLNKERFDSSSLVGEKAQAINEKIFEKISNVVPFNADIRNVYYSWSCLGQGGIVTDDLGKDHPLVNFYVGNFQDTGTAIDELGLEKRISAEENFRLVVSHEYGHILFGKHLERATEFNMRPKKMEYGNFLQSPGISQGSDEAFAFWFGDFISELKSPLESLSYGYKRRGIDFNKTISQYNKLNELEKNEGIKECFNPSKLAEIFYQ